MTTNFRIVFKLHIDFGSEFCMDFFNLWLIHSNTFCSYIFFQLKIWNIGKPCLDSIGCWRVGEHVILQTLNLKLCMKETHHLL